MKAMSQRERLQNVRDAFLVPERYRAGLEGRSVVIVDDVHTTGATIHALCDELRHGVARIGVVGRPGDREPPLEQGKRTAVGL